MKELLRTNSLPVRRQRAVHRGALRAATSRTRRSVPTEWREYFDELQLRRATRPRTWRTRRSSNRSSQLAQARRGQRARAGRRALAPSTSRCSCCSSSASTASLGLLCGRPRPAEAHAEAAHPRARPGLLRLHRGRPGHASSTPARSSGRTAMRAARHRSRRCEDTYCRTHRRRVHVHHATRATSAVDPGAPRADPRAAQAHAPSSRSTSSSG